MILFTQGVFSINVPVERPQCFDNALAPTVSLHFALWGWLKEVNRASLLEFFSAYWHCRRCNCHAQKERRKLRNLGGKAPGRDLNVCRILKTLTIPLTPNFCTLSSLRRSIRKWWRWQEADCLASRLVYNGKHEEGSKRSTVMCMHYSLC